MQKKKAIAESQPVFITTDKGDVLPYSTLGQYLIANKAAGDEKSQALPVDRFADMYQDKGLIPPLYNLETLIGTLELNTWHFRCCDVKSHDVAGLGWELKSDNEEQAGADNIILTGFFKSEKHGKPFENILTELQMDMEAIGILAMEVVRENYDPNGKPSLINHVPAHTLRPHRDGNKYMQSRGLKVRWFKRFGYEKDINKNTGDEAPLGTLNPDKDRATELIWDTSYCGRSDYYGMPPILPALGALEGSRAVRDYNIDFFRNYGIPSYAIYITGDYNLGVLKNAEGVTYDPTNPDHDINDFQYEIISAVKKHLATLASNPHSPLILAVPSKLPEGKVNIEFKPLNVEVKDASFRIYRNDCRDEIIVAHGVPPYRIGIAETGSLGGSTATESTIIYQDSVISPRQARLEALINKYIIREGFQIQGWAFKLKRIDLKQETQDKEIAGFLMDNAAMTPLELRKAFGGRFGLVVIDAIKYPELDAFYLKGQRITGVNPNPGQAEFVGAVKTLKDQIVTIATKGKE
jgi:PBSX family phage portal protein